MTDNPSDIEILAKRGILTINHKQEPSMHSLEVEKRERLHQARFKYRELAFKLLLNQKKSFQPYPFSFENNADAALSN